MKQLFIFFSLVLLASNIGFSQEPKRPVKYIFDPTANARQDLENALSKAGKEHKNLLVLVGGDWSPPCREFAATLNTDNIHTFIDDHYVFLQINFSPDNKNDTVLRSIDCPKYEGYPVIMVLDEKGKKMIGKNCNEYKYGPKDPYSEDKILKSLTSWASQKP